MQIQMPRLIAKIFAYLVHRPSYMLMQACDETLSSQPASRFAQGWSGLLLLSILSGIILIAVWNQSYGLFGEMSGLRIMPSVVAACVMVLWLSKRSVSALADFFGQGSLAGAAAGAILMILVMGLLSVKSNSWHNDVVAMPAFIAWVRPNLDECRVLALMPIWGAWAMLIACQFSRPADTTEPGIQALAAGCGAIRSTLSMALPALGTWLYLGFLGWGYLALAACTALAAVAMGMVFCRLSGKLCRRALLATNLSTQIVFLLTYLHLARS
jgi:hypothetical protein